jgi:hypothetical protein
VLLPFPAPDDFHHMGWNQLSAVHVPK